jgi:ATP-dependent DNA ligase
MACDAVRLRKRRFFSAFHAVHDADHFARGRVEDGEACSDCVRRGIVAKRADAPYRRGRSSDWVKIKTPAGRAIDEMRAKWGEAGT